VIGDLDHGQVGALAGGHRGRQEGDTQAAPDQVDEHGELGGLEQDLAVKPGRGKGPVGKRAVAPARRVIDKRLGGQLGHGGRPGGQRVPGLAHRHQRLLDHRAQAQAGRRRAGQRDEGQVEAPIEHLARQPDRTSGGQAQLDRHPRMGLVEAPEQAGQVDRAGGQHGADGDRAAQAALGLADRVPGRLGGRQRGPRLGQQHLPRVGQHDPVTVPVEQGRAEVALEGLDRAGDPRLHQVQPGRGAGEGQLLGNGDEDLEVP